MNGTGYLYAIICAAAQLLTHIVTGFCLASGSVILGMKCLISLPVASLAVINPVALNLFYLLFLKYFCKDKWKTKLFHFAMLLMQGVLADIIYQSVWGYQIGNEIWDTPFRSQAYAESCIVIAAISIMMNIIYTMIVLSVRRRKRIKINLVWIAMILFFVLMLLAILVIRETAGAAGEGGQPYFIFICIFTIMEFATVMLFLSQAEKQEAQNEKREAQEEVRKLQRVMELEKVHYEQIEARREEMAKIRHDYNNVITSVMHLIENGKTDEAGSVMKDLAWRISQTKEYPFCPVPIINAVLTEKQKVCQAEGILLKADLLFPGESLVADLDWCMIFGNLMDNAIRSCRELQGREKERWITLKAGTVQNYLIIKCRNPSLENREKIIKGTGYGHKILADIAGKYDGDFQTAYEDGIFTAQISLKQQAGT